MPDNRAPCQQQAGPVEDRHACAAENAVVLRTQLAGFAGSSSLVLGLVWPTRARCPLCAGGVEATKIRMARPDPGDPRPAKACNHGCSICQAGTRRSTRGASPAPGSRGSTTIGDHTPRGLHKLILSRLGAKVHGL